MKKVITFSILFSVFLSFSFLPSTNAQEQAVEDNERIVILFKEKVDQTIISNMNGKIKGNYKNIPAVVASVSSEEKNKLKKNPNIQAVESDIPVRIQKQPQTQTLDWGITRTNAPIAWEAGLTGKNIKIAVVDTGIANHKDLKIEGGANFVPNTTSYSDGNGHGTHVAGIIAAQNNDFGTVGIAPDSSLYAVKVLDELGQGYLSYLLAGIDWAISNKMDIINLSLELYTDSPSLEQAVIKAYNNNILVVAAAGNSGTNNNLEDSVAYPARYPSVIGVSATDSNDERAAFSSTGNMIDVAAPGVNIYSTYLKNKYTTMSGTSMASPYVAGNLALIKEAYPYLSNNEIREILYKNTLDLGEPGKDLEFGFGLIQSQ